MFHPAQAGPRVNDKGPENGFRRHPGLASDFLNPTGFSEPD
jgi:hypothetical protein